MSAAACPYCRAKICEEDLSLACEGCGTLHHADCYTENGGCTIFGCSKAPADEPKLSVSAPELLAVGTQGASGVTVARVAAPPPPPPGGTVAVEATPPPLASSPETMAEWRQMSGSFVPSIFGGFEGAGGAEIQSQPVPPQPKSRTTFILLGALLGAFGAHSFYAGYKKKGTIQLAVTLLTVGFAGPMIWAWAVIDICTINQDHLGVQFEA
jgi:TM2 domain/Prokaryotic RING finger family 1